METKLGHGNRLICLSCHRMHDGKSDRFLLAMELKDSKFCIQCHQDHIALFDTAHDLRQVSTNAQNLLGFTAEQAGPCIACHMFHHLAVEPQPATADPSGMCVNCHSSGATAILAVLIPLVRYRSDTADIPARRDGTFLTPSATETN